MRIAVISASTVPSRAANSIEVIKVCQALVQLGHEIQLWVPGTRPEINWEEMSAFYGIEQTLSIEWLPSRPNLKRYDFSWQAVRAAESWDADLLYVWPLQAAALASRRGLPTALEMHDRPSGRFGPRLFKQYLRGKGAVRLLPITDALRRYLEREYRVTLEPPFAILAPSGVDLERYQDLPNPEAAREELGFPPKLTIGYTGHLYPGRGLELMLELARRNPDTTFLWAGGEARAIHRWQERVKRGGITNLKILGFIPNKELPLVQAACDILLLPHERQVSASSGGDIAEFTSPMKLFEYLAVGRPVVASDLPVLKEALNEHNAVFATSGDVDAWDRTLNSLMEDPELRASLSAQARKDAQQYSWRARAERSLEGLPPSQDRSV